jgi:hypothetical protein
MTQIVDSIMLILIFCLAIAIMIAMLVCFAKITILPIDDEDEEWDDEIPDSLQAERSEN